MHPNSKAKGPSPIDQLFGLAEAALPRSDLTVREAELVQRGRGAALCRLLEQQLVEGAVVHLPDQVIGGVLGDVVALAVPAWDVHRA